MRIRAPRDVYDALFPLYVPSKILGLAPFKLVRGRRKRFVANCGPVTVLRFVCLVGAMCFVSVMVEQVNYSSDMSGIAMRCELYLGTLMTASVLILAVTNQRSIIDSVERIAAIDEHAKVHGVHVTYVNARKIACAQVVSITCVFLSKCVIQLYSKTWINLLLYSTFNVIDYINMMMLLQYVDLILLVRQRFVWLNGRIKSLSKHKGAYMTRIKLAFEISTSKQTLIGMSKTYHRLCTVSRVINRTYGVQILVTICGHFIMITIQLINTYDNIHDNTNDAVSYVLLSIYLVLHFLKIFMVASLSENTAAKAKNTGIYLHNLWSCLPSMQAEIEYFSLQVLHQNLTFTACGFFSLDYTLIYSIAGAVTTYFVVMVQLNNKEAN